MSNFFHWFWQLGIDYILYFILLILAIWVSKNIMFTDLKSKYAEWNYRFRIRKYHSKVELSNAVSYPNSFLKHLNLLIKTTRDERHEQDVTAFIILSALLGVLSFIFIFFVFRDIFVSAIFGLLLLMVPYLFMRLRLNNIRYLMSQEFLHIVQRLTQSYNAMHYDMYHALVETQKEVKSPALRKVLVKLVSDLQVSRSETELRDSIQVFVYTAGTTWSKRLGSIILKSYLYNEKVLNALIVLTKQMEETEEMLEEEKSSTLDTVFNGFLTIPVFAGSLILGYYTSGAQDWVNLQFGNKWTLLFFSLCILGVIFSTIIAIFLKHPRNDL